MRCEHGGVPDLSRMRNDYRVEPLREQDLAPTWVEQFDRWFADAVATTTAFGSGSSAATASANQRS